MECRDERALCAPSPAASPLSTLYLAVDERTGILGHNLNPTSATAKLYDLLDEGFFMLNELTTTFPYYLYISTPMWRRWSRGGDELTRKAKEYSVKPCSLVLLDEVATPDEVAATLKEGTKFSIPPKIPMHELAAINRKLANKAGEDSERRLLDVMRIVMRELL
ncbi:hypothetical protein HPB50_014642 [Hyalomma asiaticum]|uniref:Uncharacterized protein n=1 Tax=Hyalomma asiaticum TaxID=266040 RepID=A0ACB7RTS1_HYAAI|nr:hypothetical protein HPB50_014642 [Hyalomma asiaticum]